MEERLISFTYLQNLAQVLTEGNSKEVMKLKDSNDALGGGPRGDDETYQQ